MRERAAHLFAYVPLWFTYLQMDPREFLAVVNFLVTSITGSSKLKHKQLAGAGAGAGAGKEDGGTIQLFDLT